MMRAYLDASADFRCFGLAGYIASAESWGEFSTAWEAVRLLNEQPHEPIEPAFKMGEMDLKYPPHVERCAMFYSVIEKYVEASISVTVNVTDLHEALSAVVIPREYGKQHELRNPYFWGFIGLYQVLFHESQHLPCKEPFKVIFDSQQEKSQCMRGWEKLMKNAQTEWKNIAPDPPGFEKDERERPLQAADMLAWWVRKWESEGTLDHAIRRGELPELTWPRKRKIPHMFARFTRENLGVVIKERFK
jgi:hypothetical protein